MIKDENEDLFHLIHEKKKKSPFFSFSFFLFFCFFELDIRCDENNFTDPGVFEQNNI